MKKRVIGVLFSVLSLAVVGQEIRGPIANPAPGVLDGVYV